MIKIFPQFGKKLIFFIQVNAIVDHYFMKTDDNLCYFKSKAETIQ